MTKTVTKTIEITSCQGCPHVRKKYTFLGNYDFECWHPKMMKIHKWPGTNYPDETVGTMISQECERPSEYPTGFPKWCPLP